MDYNTIGIESDFALVKFKKLAGGGYFKIINSMVPQAIKALAYDEEQIEEIVRYAVGHGALDDAGFNKLFSRSPVKRLSRDLFVRNVLIVLGNSGEAGAAPAAATLLDDASLLARAMTAWALALLVAPEDYAEHRDRRLLSESDSAVRTEWGAGAGD